LKTSKSLAAEGKVEEALVQIERVLNYYAPFKDVPGSWWLQAAQIKLTLLVNLQRDGDAEDLIGKMMNASADAETLRAVRVQLAATWARKGQHEKAMAVYDEIINSGASNETLALAWLSKGHSLLAQKDWDTALLAYLRLPVFYPDQKLLMPQALLGSVRAYAGVDDLPDAEKAVNNLQEQFPNSPEAATAKKELQKITRNSAGGHEVSAGDP